MIINLIKTFFALTVAFGISFSSNAQNLSAGLMAHYPFDGNANDYSGNNNNGTLNGPVSVADRFGNPNSAYYFDGVNDEVTINNSSTLNPTSGISICAWYKSISFSGNGFSPIFTKGYTSHSEPYYQYKLGVNGTSYNSKFSFAVSVNGIRQQISSAANSWTPGNWYFLVGTYDGSTVKLYVDGILASSSAVTGTLSAFATNIKFGNNTTANDYINGTIDDTRIYDRALTPAEIQILYQNSMGINENTISPQVTVSPNPVNDQLFISAGDNKFDSIKFELFDAVGNSVYKAYKMVNAIDVSQFANGMYFLKTSTGNNVSYQKILIVK